MTNQFLTLPDGEHLRIAWPTANRFLFDAPEKFFARTRVNPDYGKPGWTRDCGKRFHRGCDIAPVKVTATGRLTRVIFTDCATNKDFESEEPTFVPHDDVFCVFDGIVAEVVADEGVSDFGKYIVIEHVCHWAARSSLRSTGTFRKCSLLAYRHGFCKAPRSVGWDRQAVAPTRATG